MATVRHTNGDLEAGLAAAQPSTPQAEPAHEWQVGDLLQVGNWPEPRLVLAIENAHLLVIAQSGWWNRYPVDGSFPLHWLGTTTLAYDYQGREQANRDYLAGKFTALFTL